MSVGNGDNGVEVKTRDALEIAGVTEGDIWRNAGLGPGLSGLGLGGGVTNIMLGAGFGYGPLGESELLPPLLSYWSLARDRQLSVTIDYEDFWGEAVGIAIDKGASSAFDVKGSTDLSARKGMELFNDHTNGGQGWTNFVSPHLQDFFLTDKGAFIEIDRQDNSKPGSKVIGLYHLDSLRCFLTGDPDRPVIYWDLHGRYHYMTWWQVFHISDKPNPRNNYFKVGRCAAGRVYHRLQRMVAANVFDYDEMTGRKANKLVIVQGLLQTQMEAAVGSDRANRAAQPATIHGNAALVAMLAKEGLKVETIMIREKPKDWDDEQQLEHAAIYYAAALGLDKADLKPFTGRMAGTATQSEVQHNKQEGKGLSVWRNSFEWFFSNFVLPSQASFHWNDYDAGQKQQKAELFQTYATAVTAMVGTGIPVLSAGQGIQVMVDNDQLAKEYLPGGQDITPGVEYADDEKPLFPIDNMPVAAPPAAPAPQFAQTITDPGAVQTPVQPLAALPRTAPNNPAMQKLMNAIRQQAQKVKI